VKRTCEKTPCGLLGGKFGKIIKNRLGDKAIITVTWQSLTALRMTPPGSLCRAPGNEKAGAAALLAQSLNVGGEHR
jgi:hypothetical protein